MTAKEVAPLLNLSPQTFRVYVRAGKFKDFAESVQTGKATHHYYINENRLKAYLEAKDIKERGIATILANDELREQCIIILEKMGLINKKVPDEVATSKGTNR